MAQVFKSVAATDQIGEDAQTNEQKSLESSFCEQNTAKTWAGKRVLHNTNFQTLLAKGGSPPVLNARAKITQSCVP